MLDTLFLEEQKLKDTIERTKQNPKRKPVDVVNLENKLIWIQRAINKCKLAVEICVDNRENSTF